MRSVMEPEPTPPAQMEAPGPAMPPQDEATQISAADARANNAVASRFCFLPSLCTRSMGTERNNVRSTWPFWVQPGAWKEIT